MDTIEKKEGIIWIAYEWVASFAVLALGIAAIIDYGPAAFFFVFSFVCQHFFQIAVIGLLFLILLKIPQKD